MTSLVFSKLKRDSSPNFEAIMATDQALQQKDLEVNSYTLNTRYNELFFESPTSLDLAGATVNQCGKNIRHCSVLQIKRMQEMLIKMQHQLNKQADAAIKNAANSSHGNGLKNL